MKSNSLGVDVFRCADTIILSPSIEQYCDIREALLNHASGPSSPVLCVHSAYGKLARKLVCNSTLLTCDAQPLAFRGILPTRVKAGSW